MIRKTIALKDDTYNELISSGIVSSNTVFSEVVNSALKNYIEQYKKEQYKTAICQASKDPLFLADINEIESDFAFSDGELIDAV